MELRSLASGSSGNAYLVRSGASAILVDAGLSARRLVAMLRAEQLEPAGLTGIAVSHEHSDHVRGIQQLAARFQIPIYATEGTYRALGAPPTWDWRKLIPGRIASVGSLDLLPIAVPHDAAGPCVFRIEADYTTLAIATDFGSPTDALDEAFRGLDLLVLEANHDEDWLWQGSYPWSLKKRVASDVGHISNETAAGILTRLGERAPWSVWLAHLSKHNNAPEHAKKVVRRAIDRAGLPTANLAVAERDAPSLHWTSTGVSRQLSLNL